MMIIFLNSNVTSTVKKINEFYSDKSDFTSLLFSNDINFIRDFIKR